MRGDLGVLTWILKESSRGVLGLTPILENTKFGSLNWLMIQLFVCIGFNINKILLENVVKGFQISVIEIIILTSLERKNIIVYEALTLE